jgi:hypothetical protein
MKYCQGPECHTYETQDRIRGPKGDKTYQTRRRSNFYYLGKNACSMQCERDWFNLYGERALDHFGRIYEPKRLVPENAWVKTYGQYDHTNNRCSYIIVNRLLGESRPITEEQYEDNNFTINTR